VRIELLIALALATGASAAHGNISQVQVLPSDPCPSDSVIVQVTGYTTDSCWGLPHQTVCRQIGQSLLLMDIYIRDGWEPGMACLLLGRPYERECGFGELAVGSYTIVVTEHYDSLRRSDPSTEILEFQVDSETPVLPTTWGHLKALYRVLSN
jgi:hypothetical protein